MSEFSTAEVVKHLSKVAHTEENKGHFEQAKNLYRAIVTLEEMAHFPADKIKQAQDDERQCEIKGAATGLPKVDFNLDISESKALPQVQGRAHLQLPAPEATDKHLPITTDSSDYFYPSKGCP